MNIFIYPLLVRPGSRYRHLSFDAVADLAEARHPGSGRNTVLLAIWQIGWGIVSAAICFFGGALVIETVFGVPMWMTIPILGAIAVFYCMMGGLNGAVFTDTIQWLIIVFGTAFLVPAVFAKFGSFSELFSAVLGNSGYAAVEGAAVRPGYTDLFPPPALAGVTPIALIAMGQNGRLAVDSHRSGVHVEDAGRQGPQGRRRGPRGHDGAGSRSAEVTKGQSSPGWYGGVEFS